MEEKIHRPGSQEAWVHASALCLSCCAALDCSIPPSLFQSTQQMRRLDHIKSRSSLAFHQTLELAAS